MKVIKRYLIIIIITVIFVAAIIGVIAYGTNNPSTFGHTLSEVDFPNCGANQYLTRINGQWVCQDDDVGSGATQLGVEDCYVTLVDRSSTSVAEDGFYVKGIYDYTNDNWDGYGVMFCRTDPTINTALPTAATLHNNCPWGWSYVNCNSQGVTNPAGHDYD